MKNTAYESLELVKGDLVMTFKAVVTHGVPLDVKYYVTNLYKNTVSPCKVTSAYATIEEAYQHVKTHLKWCINHGWRKI